ncbi:hypothetical protein BBJ28_00012057 [Nothophytophthora sp. Chile5]|nr:hypothetical protein BBJ28_00012057 [Nothophytophthora sp. Chile5]
MGAQDRDGLDADAAPPPPPPPPRDENADLTADQKLYWMNALQVSGDWSVHDDGEGRLFYYHRKTDASQWETPDGLAALEGEFMMKLMLQNAVARSGAWTAHDAGNGTLYYFNSKTRASVWERPSEWGQVEEEAAAPSTAPLAAQGDASDSREAVGGASEGLGGHAAEDDDQTVVKKKEKKEKKKKHKKHKTIASTEEGKAEQEVKGDDATTSAPAQELKEEEEEEEEPLTAEELQAENDRKARELKRIEQFRAMLRDKSIMPFCKWSVALPQIAGDPRFMGVQT